MPVFTANVPGSLKIGDRIEIGGKIKENARKMSVNLCAQEGEEPKDVVLHFDVRFHRDNIISLSRKNGIWIGSGNYDTNYNMFVPGTMFRIIFEIKDTDVITIYCQSKFHSNFLPKIPLSMARFIVAWADVERITHCYFYMGAKSLSGDEPAVFPAVPDCPRTAVSPVLTGDPKRCFRMRKKSPHNREGQSSNESSDGETTNGRARADGRADRYFYDTLTCQPVEQRKCGSPQPFKCRRDASKGGCRAEFSRKYKKSTDIDRIDSEETDVLSKSMDTSTIESRLVLPDVKKRLRRGKFGPFSQVVSFMGKSAKRN